MKENKFYSFKDDVMLKVVDDFAKDKSVLVFPTKNSRTYARKLYQDKWQFDDVLFLTMEEFKEQVFPSKRPILQDEKRNLMLYYSLYEELKTKLKVSSYFQFIGLAKKFFSLWQEFNEELLDINLSLESLLDGEECFDWQKELYELMQKMRELYQETLKNKEFEDKIYLFRLENAKLNTYQGYEKFIFVNQLYYTKLEETLVEKLSTEMGKNIIICSQNISSENAKELDLNEIRPEDYRTKSIHIFSSTSDFTMYKQLASLLDSEDSSQSPLKYLIDNKLFSSPYRHFLSSSKFRGIERDTVVNSQFFSFFHTLYRLIDSIIYVSNSGLNSDSQRIALIPIETLIEVFSNTFILQLLSEKEIDQGELLRDLSDLIKKGYLYIDLELEFFYKLSGVSYSPKLREMMKKLAKLVYRLANEGDIKSIKDFVETIGNPYWFPESALFSESELKQSNIVDIIFETLANFSFIDELDIIDDILANDLIKSEDKNDSFSRIKWYLKLFLLYLRPKSYRWQLGSNSANIEISSLLDSRNFSYESVGVLNVSEGDLPSAPSTPFLLSERQRKKIGLKYYEDIRSWERYYFFRLVLNSENIYLFTQKSDSKNKDASSFIEELRIALANIIQEHESDDDSGYFDLYRSILQIDKNYELPTEPYKNNEFYTIPYYREDVIEEDNIFRISFSAYNTLKKSPFNYYLKHVMKIDEASDYAQFSPALIGTLSHYLVEKVWDDLNKKGSDFLVNHWSKLGEMAKESLGRIGESFLHEFCCQVPHTHSKAYFEQIFLPIIKEGIVESFAKIGELYEGEANKISPEPEQKAQEYSPELLNSPLKVALRGRADLVVNYYRELNSDDTNPEYSIIIDYKSSTLLKNVSSETKDGYREQLLFYELLYSRELGKTVASYIYSLIDQKFYDRKALTGNKKEENDDSLGEVLEAVITSFVENGFTPDYKKDRNVPFANILRKDLQIKHFAELQKPGATQNNL